MILSSVVNYFSQFQFPGRMAQVNALKVGSLVSVVLLLAVNFDHIHIATSVVLGIIAAALSETPSHFKAKFTTFLLLTGCFFITVSAVQLLYPYPALFVLLLTIATFVFVMLAALGDNYRAIGFSSLIVATYTLLGEVSLSESIHSSLWLVVGAAIYLLYAYIWQFFLTHFSLRQQLADLFYALSSYQREKARLYGVDNKQLSQVRFKLAQKNSAIVVALEQCRILLLLDERRFAADPQYRYWYHLYMVAQRLHESAASSHLSNVSLRHALLATPVAPILRKMLLQLAIESRNLAQALEKNRFFAPNSDLENQLSQFTSALAQQKQLDQIAISSLAQNLRQMINIFRKGIFASAPDRFTIPKPQVTSAVQKIRAQLTMTSPLMRHAIRLALCLGVGYIIARVFFNTHGFWILITALMLCRPDFASSIRRISSRVIGTLGGVLSAGYMLPLLEYSWGAVLLPTLGVSAFFLFLRNHYGIAVFFISWLAASLFYFQGAEQALYIQFRVSETLVGAAITLTVLLFLWPDWKTRRLDLLCEGALQVLKAYMCAIFNPAQSPLDDASPEQTDYRIARRAAHTAETRLLETLSSIQLEPKQTKAQLNALHEFVMAYHQILSFSSAIAVHKQELEQNDYFNPVMASLIDIIEHYQAFLLKQVNTPPTEDKFGEVHIQLSQLLMQLNGRSQLACYQLQQISLVLEKLASNILILR